LDEVGTGMSQQSTGKKLPQVTGWGGLFQFVKKNRKLKHERCLGGGGARSESPTKIWTRKNPGGETEKCAMGVRKIRAHTKE